MPSCFTSLLADWPELPTRLNIIDVEFALREIFNGNQPVGYAEFISIYNGGEGAVGEEGYARFWSMEELQQKNLDYQCQEYLPNVILIGTDGGSEGFGVTIENSTALFVCVPLNNLTADAIIQGGSDFIGLLTSIGSNLI